MRPRVIFFGATNELSRSTFTTLVEHGVQVETVLVTAPGSPSDRPLQELRPADWITELPLLNRYHKPTLIEEAWTHGIPVLAMSKGGSPPLRALISEVRPDAACVACFPRRVSPDLIALPPLGFLNVHPSLLPYYRGPAPLFWLFQKNDIEHRGITVHQMDEHLDTGPIIAQESINFSNGRRQFMIERECGQVGGRLLVEALEKLSGGFRPQPQSGTGSYHPWPVWADFRLDTDWPALRAYNFMRATSGFGQRYRVSLPGCELSLTEALQVEGVDDSAESGDYDGLAVRVQFTPGVLVARVD